MQKLQVPVQAIKRIVGPGLGRSFTVIFADHQFQAVHPRTQQQLIFNAASEVAKYVKEAYLFANADGIMAHNRFPAQSWRSMQVLLPLRAVQGATTER